jgi:hypothetical protein
MTYNWCIELKISDTMGAPEVYSFMTVLKIMSRDILAYMKVLYSVKVKMETSAITVL